MKCTLHIARHTVVARHMQHLQNEQATRAGTCSTKTEFRTKESSSPCTAWDTHSPFFCRWLERDEVAPPNPKSVCISMVGTGNALKKEPLVIYKKRTTSLISFSKQNAQQALRRGCPPRACKCMKWHTYVRDSSLNVARRAYSAGEWREKVFLRNR